MDIDKLIFLDESSINTGMTRLYGRGSGSERVVDYTPDVRFERTTILSSMRVNGDTCTVYLCPLGTKYAVWFRWYLRDRLMVISLRNT